MLGEGRNQQKRAGIVIGRDQDQRRIGPGALGRRQSRRQGGPVRRSDQAAGGGGRGWLTVGHSGIVMPGGGGGKRSKSRKILNVDDKVQPTSCLKAATVRRNVCFSGRLRIREHFMANTIALVDDDRNILTSVQMALEAEGFTVRSYNDGAEALKGLTTQPADLAILDIKMPRMDGMELLGHLRKDSAMPVIFLTSKDDEVDEVLGLRMGADDYIKKPFSQRLLVERIRALLRRGELAQGTGVEAEPAIQRGELRLDPARHQCTWKGENVDLTVTEFLLLKSLAMRPGHVKSRDQLMDGAYGEHIYVDDRTIDSHVKRLRKKFKMVDADFAQIETLYGVGYRYRDSLKTIAAAMPAATAARKLAREIWTVRLLPQLPRRSRLSPLTLRILAINVVALALLGGGFVLSRRISAEPRRGTDRSTEDSRSDLRRGARRRRRRSDLAGRPRAAARALARNDAAFGRADPYARAAVRCDGRVDRR